MPLFEKINIAPAINLHLAPTDKFKTMLIRLYFHFPLDENVTRNALLARLLARGCRQYPDMRKITQFLESLYDAGFSVDVGKIGERHLIRFEFTAVAQRFLPGRTDNLLKGFDFLKKIIAEPLLEKTTSGLPGFKKSYFKQEQQNLKNLINSLIDDKMAYAQERCIQSMCQTEPFRRYEYGRVIDIFSITPAALRRYHQEVLATAPIDIFVVGQFKPARIKKMARGIFASPPFIQRRTCLRASHRQAGTRPGIKTIPPAQPSPSVAAERLIREKKNVEQGKLVMGYRTYTTLRDKDIFAGLVFNGVFGAFAHSKLFQQVREKSGLAYSVDSQFEKIKGLILVNAGIDHDQFEPTVQLIKGQLKQIQRGNISDLEFTGTLKALEDILKSLEDNPVALIDYYLGRSINGRADSIQATRAQFKKVTRRDVSRFARKIKLDTIYFLTK